MSDEIKGRTLDIARHGGDYVCVRIHTGKKATRIFLTEDQLLHAAHRFMAFASGGYGSENLCVENEV